MHRFYQKKIIPYFIITFILTCSLQVSFINPANATIFDPAITPETKNEEVNIPSDKNNFVRVGISNSSFSNYYHKNIELFSEGSLTVIDKVRHKKIQELPTGSTLYIVRENDVLQLQYSAKDSVKKEEIKFKDTPAAIVVVPSDGFTKVVGLKRSGKEAVYRGFFEIVPVEKPAGAFVLVNVLDIENYLRGVVPNEMPVSFGKEALKAQAIAARNYVLNPRSRVYKEYDICDSVACQVYFGAGTENPLSDLAIAQTENNIATYNGDLILAQYSSTAGGYTEDYENAFATQKNNYVGCKLNAIPYLKGKPDLKTIPVLNTEEAARDFYTQKHETFDSKSPFYRWQYEWDKKELEDILAKNIAKKASSPFVAIKNPDVKDFGSLQNIEVLQRGVSGKVISLKITTSTNEFIIQKELVIRQIFQKDGKNLPSANIVFDLEKSKCANNILKHIGFCKDVSEQENSSTNNKEDDFLKIKVYGGGFGHGVGMSQFGAGKMSELGFTYDEILQHYYTGIAISTPKVELNEQKNITTVNQTFYAPAKKGYLYIQNFTHPCKLTVDINGKSFDFNFNRYSKSKIYSDISDYIQIGRNYVTYTISGTGNRNKKTSVYIELKGAVHE